MDLYLNGEYAGLYLLSERNEIHPNRVDIPEETSFLVSWEIEERLTAQGYPHVVTENGRAIRIHQSAFPAEEIRMMWESVFDAIYAEDGMDPATGKHWQELIDLDSWAMRFLMDEICADHDGGGISQFFYYDESDGTGKIYAGSIWDKDITFNSGHWQISAPNAIIVSEARNKNGEKLDIFQTLFHKDVFYARMVELYQSVFVPLLTELCETGIEAYAGRISPAAGMDALRWSMGDTTGGYLVIRDFLEKRMEFLDAYWVRKETFYNVKFYAGVSGEFAVRPGEYLPEIPKYAGCEWFLEGTDVVFDVSQPIYENATVVLKRLDETEETVSIAGEVATIMTIAVSLLALGAADIWQSRRTGGKYDRDK